MPNPGLITSPRGSTQSLGAKISVSCPPPSSHQGAACAAQPRTCLSPWPSLRPPLQLISSCDLGDKNHLCSHKLDWQVSTPNLVNQEIVQSPELTPPGAAQELHGGTV